ncbi:MAG: hypothetical protein LBO69_02445 [Ignavibacteria bacterium]|jgi:hypothetical protein|nr:hypothetical protein [Ignavibacteria bacterium]
MNEIFDIKRFLTFLKTDIYTNRMKLAIIPAVLILIILMLNIGNDIQLPLEVLLTLENMIILATPIPILYNMYHKKKGLNYMMLPASQFEKLAASILQIAVIIPLIILGILVLYTFVRINPNVANSINYKSELWNAVIDTIQLQSIVFFAMFFFKSNKIAKMVATFIICFITFFTLGTNEFTANIITKNIIPLFFDVGKETYINHGAVIISSPTIKLWAKIAANILFPLLPYTLAFLKLRKTQV